MSRDAVRYFSVLIMVALPIMVRANDELYFDKNLLLGAALTQADIDRLMSGSPVLPGVYSLDVFLNGKFVSRDAVTLVDNPISHKIEPCFSESYLVDKLGLKPYARDVKEVSLNSPLMAAISSEVMGDGQGEVKCYYLGGYAPGSENKIDISSLKLELSVAQDELNSNPIGYISSAEWDSGETMFFMNYDASIYKSEYKANESFKSDYFFTAMHAGLNVGAWRIRHDSSFSYRSFDSAKNREWNNLRTYVQRSIPEITSELSVGDLYTSSSMFSGVSYRGISLAKDERMLPYSRINYAPEVRGVAATTARVIISQNNRVIREVTVPSGAFLINDLYEIASSGDLSVKIVEANGAVSEFTVPYSAVPQSIRPGNSRYGIDVGKLRDYGENDYFADFIYERGISNALTASGGARISKEYVAVSGGGVLASQLGAFGVNAVFSYADVGGKKDQGWRFGVNYSKTFQDTNTSVNLAGYRYSTKGFREFSDVVSRKNASEHGQEWNSYTYQQRNQLTLSLNQNLGEYGSVYISGSVSDYYDGKSKNNNLQVGYANVWKSISYNVAFSRQNSYFYNDFINNWGVGSAELVDYKTKPYNSLIFSFSIPLGDSARSPSLNSYVTRTVGDNKNTIFQTGMTGSLLDDSSMGYALSLGRDQNLDQTYFSGNVSKLTPVARVSGGYARGESYSQYNASVSGSFVAHSGGVTFGQYLGDTFALVEVPGGEGAILRNSSNVRIGKDGYAILSSMSPYRYNSIILDPGDVSYTTELAETERRVVPSAGASLRVKFKTIKGYPLLIVASYVDGTPLQMGSNVFDSNDAVIGVVGQGGQVYARVPELKGRLKVGIKADDLSVCYIDYKIDEADVSSDELVVIRKRGGCVFMN